MMRAIAFRAAALVVAGFTGGCVVLVVLRALIECGG